MALLMTLENESTYVEEKLTSDDMRIGMRIITFTIIYADFSVALKIPISFFANDVTT